MAPQHPTRNNFDNSGHDYESSDDYYNTESQIPRHPTEFVTWEGWTRCETQEHEELRNATIHVLDTEDKIFVSIRCAITFLCLLGTILVIVAAARSSLQRYKSWRLYLLTSLLVLAWICLTLYHDYIDEFWIGSIRHTPTRNTIYDCFRNLCQGLSLYLIVLLLSHLSDFQHRSGWLWLIAMVILVPVVFSVVLLVVEVFLPHEPCESANTPVTTEKPIISKNSFAFTTAVQTIKVTFYNVATTILLLVFSIHLCTRRLYGTYSEHRSPLVVLIARWTFVFLILHNLVALASYAAFIASKDEVCFTCLDSEVLRILTKVFDELQLFFVVLAVPGSYLIAWLCQCLCRMDNEENTMEMEKIDKMYQEVWTPSAGSTTTQIQNQPLPQPSNGAHAARKAVPSTNPGGGGNTTNGSHAGSRPSNVGGSQSTLASIDSLGELPSMGDQRNRRPTSRQKNRESYFEAVSMGSMDGTGSDRYSVTTDPVDL